MPCTVVGLYCTVDYPFDLRVWTNPTAVHES
jgi:hypothetical protein